MEQRSHYQELKELYPQGLSYAQMGEQLGIKSGYAQSLCSKFGFTQDSLLNEKRTANLKKGNHSWRSRRERMERAHELFKKGVSKDDIINELKISKSTLWNYLSALPSIPDSDQENPVSEE